MSDLGIELGIGVRLGDRAEAGGQRQEGRGRRAEAGGQRQEGRGSLHRDRENVEVD